MVSLQSATDARGFAAMQAAASAASKTFRDAAASTGQFEVQQMRLNSATDDYVKKLRQQKLSFRDIAKQRKVATAAYKEQLAMENMLVQQGVGGTRTNKGVYDVIVPKEVSGQLDTARKRMAFLNAELASGANQMVNWGKNTQWAGRQLMVGFTMPIAAFGAAAGVMAYQVDKELTRIAKVYDTTAQMGVEREKELAQVRKDSLETASTAADAYGAKMKETLNVQAELAATGKTGTELQKSTLEVMRISRLGEVDQQTAIDATIALQSIWKQSNEELAQSFNYMNSVENATSLATADFAAAIPIAGNVVKEYGGDIRELGILLTAMKENGIGAVEGANAIKATFQRLGRPSTQVRQEWQQLTGTDITQLVEGSDSLTEIFTRINEATRDLGDAERRKAFAGLFGSYQVARMMAMTKGMEDLENGVGQVSTAYKVAQQDASQWAATAESEMKSYTESISGQFDRAVAKLQTQLIPIGEPFVVLATKVIKAVTLIAKKFNDLPDFAKWAIGLSVGAAAAAGGLLMLAGLMGNLAGNLLKGVTRLGGLIFKMDILDRETRVANAATELATKAFLDEADAVTMLNNQLGLLTASLKEASIAQNQMLATGRTANTAPISAKAQAAKEKDAKYAAAKATFAVTDKNGNVRYKNNDPELKDSAGRKKAFMNAEETHAATMRELQREELAMQEASQRSMQEGSRVLGEQEEKQKRKNERIKAGTALIALESAAMGGMLLNSMTIQNDMADKILQMVMVAGLLGPTVGAAVPHVKRIGTGMKTAASSAKAAVIGATGLSGGLKAAAVGARGMGAALATAMGPVGWIAAGLTIATGVLYKSYKDHEKNRKQAIKDQKELNNLAKDFASTTGRAWTDFTDLSKERFGALRSVKQETAFEEARTYYRSDEAKSDVDAYKRLSATEKAREETQLYADAQIHLGMSAKEAGENVKAFMIAAGSSMAEANVRAAELLKNINNLGDAEGMKALMNSQRESLLDTGFNVDKKLWMRPDVKFDPETTENYVKAEADTLIGTFTQAVSQAANKEEVSAALTSFKATVMSGWDSLWTEFVANDSKVQKALAKRGIEDIEDLRSQYSKLDNTGKYRFGREIAAETGIDDGEFRRILESASAVETTLIKSYAESQGLKGEIKDINDLMNDPILLAKGLGVEEAGEKIEKIRQGVAKAKAEAAGLTGNKREEAELEAKIKEDSALNAINAVNAANGYAQSTSYNRALYYFQNKVKDTTKDAADEAKKLMGELSAIDSFTSDGLLIDFRYLGSEQTAAAAKSAMEGIQQDIVDWQNDALSQRQEADSDRISKYWDAQRDALTRRLEKDEKALDAAWDAKRDRLEEYWDNRIKKVDDTIKAEQKAEENRKKMFDAEIARINRLADIANKNIDFNVALNSGDLDEAAKIANSAEAEDTAFTFNREAERGSEASEKRIERLEAKKDRMDKAKDAALENFDKREERAKEHFKRMSQMEKDSLDTRAEAHKKSRDAYWKREKSALDKSLEVFLAMTPRNAKELQKHLSNLGMSYKDFEKSQLRPIGKNWGDYINEELHRGISNAARKAASDKMWTDMGKTAVEDIIKTIGFTSKGQFNRFMKTGEITPDKKKGFNQGGRSNVPIRHEGGFIGRSGNDSRKGVAKNYRGLHPSESMALVQKGEYVVNRKSAEMHGPLLDAINDKNNRGVMGGGYGGPGMLIGGMLAGSMMQGIKKHIGTKVSEYYASTSYGAWSGQNGPTAYNLGSVKPWVAEAANYLGGKFGITSIGGVGDRGNNPFSDHPNGLALDFMTNDVSRGWALANEALRLKKNLDATYMIWQKQIHSFDGRGWRPYRHPSGASNPTLDHMDHVHISFARNGKAGDLPAFGNAGGFVQGAGGKAHPTGGLGVNRQTIHGSPAALDFSLPVGNKIYAVRDGVVSTSKDLVGYEPRAAHGGNGYRSYGRYITIQHDGGGSSLYAHLSQRFAQAGQKVKAGSVIGLSGNTGMSTGPHLHFGATPDPRVYLRKGTEYVKYDNTPAMLHRGESVMTKSITSKLQQGAENFANGGNDTYNAKVEINGFDGSVRELARLVVAEMKKENMRKPQKRTVGGRG